MKKYILVLFVSLMLPFTSIAQEQDSTKVKGKFVAFFSPDEKLQRSAFEGGTLIDNPTNVVFNAKTLEIMMQHRFGLISGNNDLIGFWGAANIRIAASYTIIDRLSIGFGTTKDKRLQDFNLKGAIVQQTRSEKVPLSITYYGNFTIDARTMDNTDDLTYYQDRYSYFNQLIFARRFTPAFSLQIAPSISHFNVVDDEMRNDMIAISVGGRLKITPGTSIVIDYSQPLTKFMNFNPNPGFSAGFEFGTSGHTFSIFATNYHEIVPQYNYVYNDNNFFEGDILFGFNITRNYNF